MIGERLDAPVPTGTTAIPGALEIVGGHQVRRVEIYEGPQLVEVRYRRCADAHANELIGDTRAAFCDAWLEVRHWIEPWARRRVLRAGLLQWRQRARPRWRPACVADEQPIALWMAFTAWRMGGWRWNERTIEHFETELDPGPGGPAPDGSL